MKNDFLHIARVGQPILSPPSWLISSGTGYLSPWWSTCLGDISSLKEYISFTSDGSRLQNLRICTPFPTTLSMLHDQESHPSSFSSLPSNSGLLLPFSRHRGSKVTMGLPRHWTGAEIFSHISQLTQGRRSSGWHLFCEFLLFSLVSVCLSSFSCSCDCPTLE